MYVNIKIGTFAEKSKKPYRFGDFVAKGTTAKDQTWERGQVTIGCRGFYRALDRATICRPVQCFVLFGIVCGCALNYLHAFQDSLRTF
jgi:hypothetical protein